MDLKKIAAELEQVAGEKPVAEQTPPDDLLGAVTEDKGFDADRVARAAFDYVLSQLVESDDSETIGGAFMTGAVAMAEDAGVDKQEVAKAMVNLLDNIAAHAREML